MPAIPASHARQLRQVRDATLPFFELPERRLAKRYRRGSWTAREVLIHIADTEAVFLDRLRRVIAEDRPLLIPFDHESWARRLDYARRDLMVARAVFQANRDAAIELIAAHRSDGGRIGIHAHDGALTFAQLATKMLWHNQHHLEQVQQAVGRR